MNNLRDETDVVRDLWYAMYRHARKVYSESGEYPAGLVPQVRAMFPAFNNSRYYQVLTIAKHLSTCSHAVGQRRFNQLAAVCNEMKLERNRLKERIVRRKLRRTDYTPQLDKTFPRMMDNRKCHIKQLLRINGRLP